MSNQANGRILCDPEDDNELIRRWQAGDESVEPLLWERHRDWVAKKARRFRWAVTDADTLDAMGATSFWRAVQEFDVGRGVPFRAYAQKTVKGRLLDDARTEAGIGHDPFRLYTSVRSAMEELDLAPAEAVQDGALLAVLLDAVERTEVAANLLRGGEGGKDRWSRNRLHRAVRKVLAFLTKPSLSLSDVEAGLHRQEMQPPFGLYASSPEDIVLAADACRARKLRRLRLASERLGCPERARRWFVLAELYVEQDLAWDEVCRWLRGEEPQAVSVWPAIHESENLPTAVPAAWRDVQKIFAGQAPALNPAAIRRWYCNQNERLQAAVPPQEAK